MPVPSKTLLDDVAKALAKKAAQNRQGQFLPNGQRTMQFERRFDLAPRRPDMRDVRRGVGMPEPETNYNRIQNGPDGRVNLEAFRRMPQELLDGYDEYGY